MSEPAHLTLSPPSDTRHTAPPLSQKRLMKAIDRSAAWLAALPAPNAAAAVAAPTILVDLPVPHSPRLSPNPSTPSTVFQHTTQASQATPSISSFSVSPLPHRPIPTQLSPPSYTRPSHRSHPPNHASCTAQRAHTTCCASSGTYVSTLLDARWAIDAASCGVALDFVFPVPEDRDSVNSKKKKEIGHNLYDTIYRLDFSSLSDSQPASHRIVHGPFEVSPASSTPHNPPYTRAYLHHLLHTHKMSVHFLLVPHNLAVVFSLLNTMRGVLFSPSPFVDQVQSFEVRTTTLILIPISERGTQTRT
ncbi:hypothetical protein C0995_009074 [Termitomyces sp. Mi166|nr:hypothetical protein C0995_009074 [Termitomyces sp. Mi166\